jgi:hypothetical protein
VSENKEITPKDFLKEDFVKEIKYVPFDETIEVKEARTAIEKEAWREVYSFAHLINREGRQFTDTDILNLCERFLLNKDKVRGVFTKVFKENEEAFGITDKPEIFKVEYFLRKNWEFVRNEVTQRSEYRPASGEKDFEKLNVDTLYRKLQHVNFKFSMEKLKSLLKSDFMKTYNPFLNYFEQLPAWNYEKDHIGELANYVTATNQEFHVTQFRKMLVRSVGCALYGIENRFVYVFVGEKQETGKSTFIRFLNPFGAKYYTEAPIRDNKDTYFSFSENFIQNLEELASLSNIEVNHLKSIISMSMIKERKAFAVDAEEQPRRVNFFGSTNKDEFLTDSENARWLCVNVENINWGYKKEVDIHAVWSQAFALFHDPNFDQSLTSDEMKERDTMNKSFEITDIEKDLIKQCFELADEADPEAAFYSLPDILTTLQEKFLGKTLNAKFIGKSMTQLGFSKGSKRINGHKTRGYFVKLRTTSQYKNEAENDQKAAKSALEKAAEAVQKEIKFKF